MIQDTCIALLIGFCVTALLCPLLIPLLHRFKFGQQVRQEGPKEHLKKSGTPTMGGICFLTGTLISSLFLLKKYPQVLPILLFTLGYGMIGGIDDSLKILKKKSEGLKSMEKMLLQIGITAVFLCYVYHRDPDYGILLPFTGSQETGLYLYLGLLWLPFAGFVIVGTDNGVNFTDGLDGLCASVTIAVAGFFLAAGLKMGLEITPITGGLIGSLLGFLLFNVYPARVFMGDTGSLALGGFVASYAILAKMPVFIALVGVVYLAEVLSVIIQVGYFKKTKGKRFFKMAPIHHHFELCGWSETRVVAVFTTITILLGIVVYLGL